MLHNIDSDTDISKIELSEQLPLQSDIDHLSNLDIELDDDINNNNDIDNIDNIDDINNIEEEDEIDIKKISKSLNLVNYDDDTDDTDLDVQKELNTECREYEKPWYYKAKNWLKLNIVFFLLALLISGLSQPKLIWNILEIFLSWMENNLLYGSFALIGLYITCDLFMIDTNFNVIK